MPSVWIGPWSWVLPQRDSIARPVQGNLDPLALLAGGSALDRSVEAILGAFSGGPFIFNLGHGILPETPIAHVERLIARVRYVVKLIVRGVNHGEKA